MTKFFFWTLLALVYAAAALRGRRDERIAALVCLGATVLSIAVRAPWRQSYSGVEFGVLSVDLATLAVFVGVALRSPRFWPLWIAGLQLSTLLARLSALMGERRCGSPMEVDSWQPGAFAMKPFAPRDSNDSTARADRTLRLRDAALRSGLLERSGAYQAQQLLCLRHQSPHRHVSAARTRVRTHDHRHELRGCGDGVQVRRCA